MALDEENQENITTPATEGTSVNAGAIPLPPTLQVISAEIATYYRELPRLLAEGHDGRVALIKGDQLVGICDTFADAYRTGQERFGLEPFIAQPIDSRDLPRPAETNPH